MLFVVTRSTQNDALSAAFSSYRATGFPFNYESLMHKLNNANLLSGATSVLHFESLHNKSKMAPEPLTMHSSEGYVWL